MSKEEKIIVGEFDANGMFKPHFVCLDDAKALAGQQIALSVMTAEPEKMRTQLQNRSLHKYFSNISKALNDAGYDQRGIMASIGKGAPIPWSEFSVKALWKSIQLARHGKDSTTKLLSEEYSVEHRIFDNMINVASDGNVSEPIPSRDSQSWQ